MARHTYMYSSRHPSQRLPSTPDISRNSSLKCLENRAMFLKELYPELMYSNISQRMETLQIMDSNLWINRKTRNLPKSFTIKSKMGTNFQISYKIRDPVKQPIIAQKKQQTSTFCVPYYNLQKIEGILDSYGYKDPQDVERVIQLE